MSAEVNVANNNNNTTAQTASQTAQSSSGSSSSSGNSESCECKPVVINFYIGCCPVKTE